ncbi:hypothetical protein EON62_01135 [archaeon]|nr:MAG: hypothetical protein EON62_01135 [archaeon]
MSPRAAAAVVLRAALLLLAGVQLAHGLAQPAIDVDISSAGSYVWVDGAVNVTWTQSGSDVPASYEVSIAPLDYTYPFNTIIDTQDFTFDAGGVAAHAQTVGGGKLLLTYTGDSHQEFSTGRGKAPFMYRRMPAGSKLTVTLDACGVPSDALSAACGLTVFHGGTNMPFITAMINTTAGSYVLPSSPAPCPHPVNSRTLHAPLSRA